MKRNPFLLFRKTVLITLVIVCHPFESSSQKPSSNIKLFVNTIFDERKSDSAVYNKYFNEKINKTLASFVSNGLRQSLAAKFDEIAIKIDIDTSLRSLSDQDLNTNTVYFLRDTIFVDAESSLNRKVSLIDIASDRKAYSFNRVLKAYLVKRRDWWGFLENNKDSVNAELRIEQILHEIATALVARIDDNIVRSIVEASLKIRVRVDKFTKTGGKENYDYLENALTSTIVTDLANSEEIVVFAKTDSCRGGVKPLPNYIINGTFFEINDQLRIDIRCIKIPSSRILASRKVLIDVIDIPGLSRAIKDVTVQLKRKMEADFRSSTKTLAIVAKPPVRLYSTGSATSDDFLNTKEIVRSLTQKLRLLSVESSEGKKTLNLQILDNPDKIDGYLEEPAVPADILADLDVDYLVVLSYENFGLEIRLTANLHSYEVERPAASQFVYEDKVRKNRVNGAINKAAIELLKTLCPEVVSSPCDSLQSKDYTREILGNIDQIKASDLQRIKGAGMRFGAVAHRNGPALYGDEDSGAYVEAYFSYEITFWKLRFAVEPTVGLDLGRGSLTMNGITSLNGFMNLKLVYSGWRYSNFPLIISTGGGLGFQGLRYDLSQDNSFFLGDKPYQMSVSRFASNLFVEMEFPIWEKMNLHVLLRKISESKTISKFATVPLEINAERVTPIGKLGGYYLVLGFKYMWR